MSKYADPDAKPEKGEPSPHRDLNENVRFYNLQMDRVQWCANCPVSFEIQDTTTESIFNPSNEKWENTKRVKEYKCALFLYPNNGETVATIISFHQPSRKGDKDPGFKEQLCAVLNLLGGRGYLVHKTRNNDGRSRTTSATQNNSKWNELFARLQELLQIRHYQDCCIPTR